MNHLLEKFLFLSAVLLLHTKSYCQEKDKREYKILDTIPDVTLGNMLNYPTDTLRLSDIKGKVILFDFWNTGCMPCVEGFPMIDSLQKVFKDKVQFVLVNKESKNATLQFFAKRKQIKKPTVPMVTGDERLIEMFPAKSYPSHIWLSKDRVVRYISFGRNTTAEHINRFLEGEDIKLQDITNIESNKAIVQAEKAEYYSYISRCQDNINIGYSDKVPVKNGTALQLSSNCSSIIDLYKKAYREFNKYNFDPSYSIRLDLSDPTKYMAPISASDYAAWEKLHCYSYELQVPINNTNRFYKIMQQDLNRFFGLEANIQKRKIKSLILVKRKGKDLLATHGGEPIEQFEGSTWLRPKEDSVRTLINRPFERLVIWLRLWIRGSYPFFNHVSYKGNIDISLSDAAVRELNIKKLRKELKKYGLDLRERKRKVAVLMIKE